MTNIRLLTPKETTRLSQAIHLLSTTKIDGFSGLPFLAPAFAQTKVFVDEECDTAYTDGNFRVGISSTFLDETKTSLAQLAFAFAHETLHSFMRHGLRQHRSKQNTTVFNTVGDLEINSQLIEGCLGATCIGPITEGPNATNGRWEYITGGVIEIDGEKHVCCLVPGKDEFSDYAPGLTAEAYLKLIQDNAEIQNEFDRISATSASDLSVDQADLSNPTGSQSQQTGEGAGGSAGSNKKRPVQNTVSSPFLSTDDLRDETDEVFRKATELGIEATGAAHREVIEEACRRQAKDYMRKNPGNTSLMRALQFIFSCIEPSNRDWKDIFTELVVDGLGDAVAGSADYSFTHISRRRRLENFIFPGFNTHEAKIACVLDTSCSMEEEDFRHAASDVLSILEETASIQVACCDAVCPEIFSASDIETVLTRLKGGGGTDLRPAVTRLQTEGEPYDLGVILTDGWFNVKSLGRCLAEDGHPWVIVLTDVQHDISNFASKIAASGADQVKVVCYNH